jgi:hypothetical protein
MMVRTPPRPQPRLEVVDVGLAPDERGRCGDVVVTLGGHGPHRDRVVETLERIEHGGQPDRAVEVARAKGPDGLETHTRGIARGLDGVVRRDHLTPVGRTYDTCRLVEGERHIVTVRGEAMPACTPTRMRTTASDGHG